MIICSRENGLHLRNFSSCVSDFCTTTIEKRLFQNTIKKLPVAYQQRKKHESISQTPFFRAMQKTYTGKQA